jgi:hypothetical protein
LKADLSDFISVEMSLLRVFKHRFFSLMFENSGAKSASASLLLTLLFFKMDKVELRLIVQMSSHINCLYSHSYLKLFNGEVDVGRNRHQARQK